MAAVLAEKAKEEMTLEERFAAAVKARNIPVVRLESDGNGHIIIDDRIKEQYPDIYDWAVNG